MKLAMFLERVFEPITTKKYKEEIDRISQIYTVLISHLRPMMESIRHDIDTNEMSKLPHSVFQLRGIKTHQGPGKYFKTTSSVNFDWCIYKICKDLYCYIFYFTTLSGYKIKTLNEQEIGHIKNAFINLEYRYKKYTETTLCLILDGLKILCKNLHSKKILNMSTISKLKNNKNKNTGTNDNNNEQHVTLLSDYTNDDRDAQINNKLIGRVIQHYNNTQNYNLMTCNMFGEIIKCRTYAQKWVLLFEIYCYCGNNDLVLPLCFKSVEWLVHVERIVWDQKIDKQRFRIEWIDDTITFIDFYQISVYNNCPKISFSKMKKCWSILANHLDSLKIKMANNGK